jgi:hypothetical protein
MLEQVRGDRLARPVASARFELADAPGIGIAGCGRRKRHRPHEAAGDGLHVRGVAAE